MTRKTIDYKDSEVRKSFIGGSDAAAVLGLSRYKTPLQVWAEKTGQIQPDDISDITHVKAGIYLEEFIAQLFTEKTGMKVRRANETFFHDDHDFLAVNLDRRIVGTDFFLECKSTEVWNAKQWEGEDIPQEYIIQCLHGLAVTGMEKCYIAVLIGKGDFRWKEIQRDEKTISAIIDQEVKFWNDFVVPAVMPTRITSNDADTLLALFPNAQPESVINLNDDILKVIESRNAMIQDLKSLESQIDQQENTIKAFLGENEKAESTMFSVTWKNQTTKRLDTKLLKESEPKLYEKYAKDSITRVLRIKSKTEGNG
jgi:putative phage-type endonuclease